MKKILFVFQSAPYDSGSAKDGIDAALVAAAFGADVAVLFSGDAIYQLLPNQNGKLLGGKSIEKLLRSFDLYDINRLYVDVDSLRQRGIALPEKDALACAPLEHSEIRKLLQENDIVMSF